MGFIVEFSGSWYSGEIVNVGVIEGGRELFKR